MKVVSGTVKSYDQNTGKGLIAMHGEKDDVFVDLVGSRNVRLAVGQRVEFQRIHRPKGVFAFNVNVIQ